MTTANKITLVRIVLIPIFLVLAYLDLTWWALAVYIIACISDTVDGYIARHYKQVTDFGKFIDPLADKMLVLAAMVFFVEKGGMPGWSVAVVLFREFAVSGLRMIAVCRRLVRQDQDFCHHDRPGRAAGLRGRDRSQVDRRRPDRGHHRLLRRGVFHQKSRCIQRCKIRRVP